MFVSVRCRLVQLFFLTNFSFSKYTSQGHETKICKHLGGDFRLKSIFPVWGRKKWIFFLDSKFYKIKMIARDQAIYIENMSPEFREFQSKPSFYQIFVNGSEHNYIPVRDEFGARSDKESCEIWNQPTNENLIFAYDYAAKERLEFFKFGIDQFHYCELESLTENVVLKMKSLIIRRCSNYFFFCPKNSSALVACPKAAQAELRFHYAPHGFVHRSQLYLIDPPQVFILDADQLYSTLFGKTQCKEMGYDQITLRYLFRCDLETQQTRGLFLFGGIIAGSMVMWIYSLCERSSESETLSEWTSPILRTRRRRRRSPFCSPDRMPLIQNRSPRFKSKTNVKLFSPDARRRSPKKSSARHKLIPIRLSNKNLNNNNKI